MAEETLDTQGAAEEKVADMIFGSAVEEVIAPPKAQKAPKPVPEGDESEDVEAAEESEDTEEAEESDEDAFVEVEYEGRLYEVPTVMKDALLRQQDYTQKTQEVAQQRKTIEVSLGQVKQAQEQYQFVQQIQPDLLKAQQLEATAQQYDQYLRSNIDDLSAIEIEKVRMARDDSREERDKLIKDIEQRQQTFQQAQQQSFQELLDKGTEVLKAKIPTWGEASQKQVRQYALSNGFTEAEIAGVVDPRQVEVLWKASQYDTLLAGKATAVKQVQGAPTIKPKSRNPMPKKVQEDLNLRKKIKSSTKPASEKATLIGEHIASRFKM